jgi:hypothetical protein
MDNLFIADINGVSFICDELTQRAWFRDENGKVRYQEVRDGKCKESVSAIQRKTDNRRKPEVQERITQIWDRLHQSDILVYTY